MGLLLLIIVIVLLMGGLPRWGYHSYGWGPSGIAGVVGEVKDNWSKQLSK